MTHFPSKLPSSDPGGQSDHRVASLGFGLFGKQKGADKKSGCPPEKNPEVSAEMRRIDILYP